jgi:SAM-dependent methyltransferase
MPRPRRPPNTTVSPARERAHGRLVERSLRQGTRALYLDAGLFDQLYRRRSQDVRFYVDMAQRFGGPVLELGVGSGRVANAIARAGLDVVGVDVMASMLKAARERTAALPQAARARVRLVRGDLRTLRLGRRFPLVIAPFNTLAHFYGLRDLERALATCLRHLRPGGRFVFDVPLPDLRALIQDSERLYRLRPVTHPGTGARHGYAEASHYDAVRQVRTVTMVFERPDRSVDFAVPLTQRQLFPAELEALLHYNGFTVEERHGDFVGGPLRDDSESQVIIARARRRG